MEFRIGKITAKCPACGTTNFKSNGGPHGSLSKFHCAKCGEPSFYKDLIHQIGRAGTRDKRKPAARVSRKAA
jgi:transposase-like protein